MNFRTLLSAVVFGGLMVSSASCNLDLGPDDPPVVKRSTFSLSNGIKVQVKETMINGFRDRSYKYHFTAGRKPIAASWWNDSMIIRTGQSQGIPYFYQRSIICLSYQSRWIAWEGISDGGSRDWWPYFSPDTGAPYGRALNYPSPWERNFRIEKFTVRGKAWIITIHTGTTGHKDDWSGGLVPRYVYVVSTDLGKSWKAKGDTRIESDSDRKGQRLPPSAPSTHGATRI